MLKQVQINGRTYNVLSIVGSLAWVQLPTGRKAYIAHVYSNGTAALLSRKGE